MRLGTTVAVEAGQPLLSACCRARARRRGLDAEIVGTLFAVISLTGVPRAVAAAPRLGLALGYDVEAALEGADA